MQTRFNQLKKVSLKNPILIVGLPGIGLIGKIAAEYLIDQLKPVKIAEINSDYFPPSVFSIKGQLSLIGDEVHFLKGKRNDFLFLTGPVQPILDARVNNSEAHYAFNRFLLAEFKKLGVKKIITLAGIDIGEARLNQEPLVVVSATDKKSLQEFKDLACLPYNDGLITGSAGMMLGLGLHEGFNGACLMGQTSARMVFADHQAAKKVIELLVKKFGFKVNIKSIEEEAKKVEQAFIDLNKQIELQKQMQQPVEEDSKQRLSYTG